MIKIRDCEIMDILPYTFKTPRWQALSKAFLKVRAMCYDTMSSVLFWGDIENADPALLDAMAAELSAPFYSMDMSIPDYTEKADIPCLVRENVENAEELLEAINSGIIQLQNNMSGFDILCDGKIL